MIKSFADKKTQAFYEGRTVKAFRAFEQIAERKLTMLDAAVSFLICDHPRETGWKR